MNKQLKKALQETPLQFYDTVLFFSADSSAEQKQDFAMIGDAALIQKHLAAMIMRCPALQELIENALFIAAIAKKQSSG